MRISEAMQRTGLSRKAIHYYIEQGLVSPKMEGENAYFNFLEADIETLCAVRRLRELDLSVPEVKNLLEHPDAARYYIVRRQKDVLRQKKRLERQEHAMRVLLEELPMAATRADLLAALPETAPLGAEDEPLDMVDAYLLASFFWGMFMHDAEMTEYRRFLWDRLQCGIVVGQTPETARLRDYLYALSAEQTVQVFVLHSSIVDRIATLNRDGYAAFETEMVSGICEMLKRPNSVLLWKKLYPDLARPSTAFFDSGASALLRELSPRFASYQTNINACCAGVRHFLDTPEGAPLFTELQKKLGPCLDLDIHHSGELAALYSFELWK